MSHLRPIRIVLISFYCFFVALLFLSVTANTIFSDNKDLSTVDIFTWVPAALFVVFTAVSVAVGIGILFYNQLCWKILFFGLMISISTMASLVLVTLIFLCLDVRLFVQAAQDIHISFTNQLSFLTIFLSGIIVLYYLTNEETMSYFGEMGEIIEPF